MTIDHPPPKASLPSAPKLRRFNPTTGAGLRLGIDGDALRHPMSGVGKYVLKLCQALQAAWPQADYLLYTRLQDGDVALPSLHWTVRRETSAAWRKVPSFLWLRTRGAMLARRDHLTAFWAGRTIGPVLEPEVLSIATVHDLNHRIVPQTMQRASLWSMQLWFDDEVRRAGLLLANSQGTSDRLVQWNGRAADAVVLPGVDEGFGPLTDAERLTAAAQLASRYDIRAPYILAVGTLEPRKNLRMLHAAWRLLRAQGRLSEHQLVIVGARGWQDLSLMAALEADQPLGVRIPGFVPDADLPALYAQATVLACPSLHEGFGLPVLEARACGTRVLVADVPELREAGGASATVVGSTSDTAGLADALMSAMARDRVLEDAHDWRWSCRVEALQAALVDATESFALRA